MRLFAAAAIALLLAACSGAPKKPPAPDRQAGHSPQQHRGGAAQQRPGQRTPRRSPYPAAQEDLSKRGDYVAGGLYAPHIRDSAPDYIPDVDAIPEPEVVDEPRSRYGNRSPYTVLGRSYHVMDDYEGFVEQGIASYYGNKFHGRRTSNLEVYDMYAFTAAHKALPLPSFARVTNLANGRSVVVRVNDRGPFHEGRVVDLSWAAAVKLDMHRQGTAQVEVRALSPGEHARHDYDAVAATAPAPAPEAAPQPSSMLDGFLDALPIASAAAGERPLPPPTAAPVAPAPADGTAVPPHEHRFNMMQDGKVMTADDFDAWLAQRRINLRGERDPAAEREAMGVQAAPATVADSAPPAAAPASAATATATATATAVPAPAAAVPAATAQAAPAAAAGVTLQVAAFSARDNAERALSMLQGAGVAGARLVDSIAGGRTVWRLQVGPVSAASVPELSARFAGLGFGRPHVVRE